MTTPEAGENTMSNTLDEILAPWVGFVHSEYDGTSMVDDELAVIATAKQQIQALITEARIDEVENHPKKSDNRWRDYRLAQLKENN